MFIVLSLSGQNDFSEPWERAFNERQPPEYVFKSIGVKQGMTIGEIGAGRGRYTVLLARKTGSSGKVYANDIDELSLAYLRGRCRRLNIDNVETIVGEKDNALFPDNSLDMAIVVLVYHMIEDPDILLANLKKSLKQGSHLVILDPRDDEIDREFGIDRSKPVSVPTILKRIQNSAKASGYQLVKTDTTLPHDYIFILEPRSTEMKKSAAGLIQRSMLQKGIDSTLILFDKIKSDSAEYDLSERVFAILGYELIGAKQYPEAIAVLKMGLDLFPKSSKIYGEMGEIYLLTGEKEKARQSYRLYLDYGPDSLRADEIMKNFDMMYEQMNRQ